MRASNELHLDIGWSKTTKKSVSESKLKFDNRQNQLLDMLKLTLLTDSYEDAILSLLYEEDTNDQVNTILTTA